MRTIIAMALLGFFLLSSGAHAETRVALVISNSHYTNITALTNPENDGTLVADSLKRAGFDHVELKKDLGYTQLLAALHSFAQMAANADVVLIYYAGHGMEMKGTNYIIPVDAKLMRDGDIDFEAIPLTLLMQSAGNARKLKIIVLDACRNNPFGGRAADGATRGIGRGLARIEPASPNMLVAYAAKDGTTAEDGDGKNSPFATAFAAEITVPGAEVQFIFRRIRDDVLTTTGKRQEPFTYGSLGGDPMYFVALRPGQSAGVPATSTRNNTKEVEDWLAIVDSQDKGQLQGYLDRYPSGRFSADARRKIASLGAASAAPVQANAQMQMENAQAEALARSWQTIGRPTNFLTDMGESAAREAKIVAQQIDGSPPNMSRWHAGQCAYAGNVREGTTLPNGYGVQYCKGGTRSAGRWDNGQFKSGVRYLADGSSETGQYDGNGFLESGFTKGAPGTYREAIGMFVNGQLSGLGARYENDGSCWLAYWVQGKLNGPVVKLDSQGQIIGRYKYTSGVLDHQIKN